MYDFGAYVPGNTQSQKRAIYQFDGHVRQFDGDPNQTITLTGLNPQGTGARAGFVAYEGDRAIGGDVVRYSDSTTASGPLTGQVRANNNMWVGYAQGATRYYGTATDFYNASVDAYSLTLPGLVTGDTFMTLQLSTTQDSYLMQNAIVSVPTADVSIYKTAANGDPFQVLLPGQAPTFKITVYNSGGGAPVTNAVVTDQQVPGCSTTAGQIPTLAIAASYSYTCTAPVTSTGYTNMASVTALSAGIQLQNSNTTDVQIATMDFAKAPKNVDVPYGTPGTYVMTIVNTGSAELRNVTVSDPGFPTCERTFASIPAGQTVTYECQTPNLTSQTSNSASVTAQAGSPNQTPLTITSSTTTPAVIKVSRIETTKTVDNPYVTTGGTATFTFTVRNTGETALSPVKVSDPAFPACDRTFASLAVGASTTYTCTVNITTGITNTATATGTPPSGTNVTATSSVRVDTKAMTLDKRSATTDVNGNGMVPSRCSTGPSGCTCPGSSRTSSHCRRVGRESCCASDGSTTPRRGLWTGGSGPRRPPHTGASSTGSRSPGCSVRKAGGGRPPLWSCSTGCSPPPRPLDAAAV